MGKMRDTLLVGLAVLAAEVGPGIVEHPVRSFNTATNIVDYGDQAYADWGYCTTPTSESQPTASAPNCAQFTNLVERILEGGLIFAAGLGSVALYRRMGGGEGGGHGGH
jgi:hypothetical protein